MSRHLVHVLFEFEPLLCIVFCHLLDVVFTYSSLKHLRYNIVQDVGITMTTIFDLWSNHEKQQ